MEYAIITTPNATIIGKLVCYQYGGFLLNDSMHIEIDGESLVRKTAPYKMGLLILNAKSVMETTEAIYDIVRTDS